MSIKIGVIEDHHIIIDGWKSIINELKQFEISMVYNSGKQFSDVLKKNDELPYILILDIDLPDINGLDLLNEIRKVNPTQKVIISSLHDDIRYVKKAVKFDVQGYLLKDSSEQEIIECLNTVANGKRYYSNIIKSKIVKTAFAPEKEFTLTPKELEILECISKGYSNIEIADIQNISKRTVDTHRLNIMKKLEAQNVAELIAIAVKLNLVK